MEALSAVEMTKIKLAQPQLFYRKIVHVRRYNDALGGQSWPTKMERALSLDIALYNFISYINELLPEQQSALQAAVDKLHALVYYDQGLYIFDLSRDISCEILGICHQITGNLDAALYTYQQALTHLSSINNIRIATQTRIHDVVRTNTSGQNI